MAGSYQNKISLGIKLQPSSEVQTELNSLIKELNKNSTIDLNIDTKQINQSLNDFSSTLIAVGEQLKSHFNMHGVADEIDMLQKKITKVKGSSLDIGDGSKGFDELQARAKAIRETVDELAKISFNTSKNGAVKDATITYTDNMGKLVSETMEWKNVSAGAENEVKRVFTTTNIAVSENIKALENYKTKIENVKSTMQNKLNTAKGNEFIDESVITELQSRLNSINTNTAEKEIKELQTTINNLGSSDSQIVRLQSTISKMENTLTNMKGKYGSLVGDSSSKAQLESYTSQVEKLKTILTSLQNGGTISGSKLASELNQGTNASRELSTAVKNSSNALKLATVDSETFGQSIKRALSNTGIYMGTYQAINMITNAFKDGLKNIIDIDTQMRDLAKVSNATTEQLSNFSQVANKIAINVGASTESVISATTYYSKLGYSIEEASKRAEKATIFANVADMGIDDASKALITIQKGFDLNSLEDMNRIMDVANAIGNNYSSTSQNVAEGLRRMGNAMKEAGNSYEQSVGLFVAGNASVQDAEVVGNAIKTITMRLRGMKTEIDETGIPASKLRQAIKDITATTGQEIDIMKDNNTYKSTYEQMTELSKVYPKLTDAQRSYLQYVIAGQRQGNIFSGMMTNMTEGVNAYTTAMNSSGSAMREQQIFMNSIEGKLNKLKETFKQFWVSTISSNSVKNTVDVLTKLVSTFANLPTVVGLATVAFLVFKGQAITSAISGLVSYVSTLVTVTKSTGALKLATAELDIALSTNPFGLIAIAITGAVVAMDLFNESIEKTKQSNEDYIQSLQNKNPNQGQELLDNYKKLQSELSTLKQGTQEYKTKEEELATAQQSLITLYPQASSAIDENTGKKKLNADATQGLIDKEKQFAQAQATKILSDNDVKKTEDIQKLADAYSKAKAEMDKYQEMYNNGERTTSVQVKTPKGGVQYAKLDVSDAIEKSKEATEKYQLKLESAKGALGQLDDKSGSYAGSLDIINSALAVSSEKTDENTKAKEQNKDVETDTDKIAEAEQKNANAIAESTEEYNKSTQAIAKAEGYIQKLNKAQTVTPTLGKSIANSYKDIGTDINNVGDTIDFLKEKVKEQQEAQENALMIMKGDDADYYKEKVANNQDYEDQINAFLTSFTGNSQEAYTVDLSQFTTLNQMKAGVQDTLKSAVDGFMKNFVDINAEGYKVDYSNFNTLIGAKKEIMKQMAGSMAQFWDDTSQAFGEGAYGGVDLSGSNKETTEQYKAFEQKAKGVLATGDKIRDAYKQLDGIYAGGGLNLKGFDGGGGTNFGEAPSKGKSDAEKAEDKAKKLAEEIDKMEAKFTVDPYFELNNAIKGVDNELTVNKTLIDSLTEGSPEYEKAQLAQIELDKKKQQSLIDLNDEQKKQANILKDYLTQYGFTTDEMGNLTNSQKQIEYWKNITDAMTGSTEEEKAKKQEWIDWISELEKKTSDYNSLVNDKIPSVANQWSAVGNEIKKTTEEIKKANEELKKTNEETVKTLRDELAQNILKDAQNEVDNLKKEAQQAQEDAKQALEDEKTAKLALWDEKIKSKQAELDALNDESSDNEAKLQKLQTELSLWKKDNSTESTAKQIDLQNQISELQKTIQKNNLQKSIDDLNTKKQTASDFYDNELTELEKANKEQEEENQTKYDEMLSEENAYNKSNKLLKEKNFTEVEELINSHSEKWKDLGSIIGDKFDEGLSITDRLQKVSDAIDQLANKDIKIGGNKDTINDSDSSSSNVYVAENTGGLPPADSESSTSSSSSSSSSSKSKTYSNGDYEDSNGYYHSSSSSSTYYDADSGTYKKYASYDTGGRTPDDIPDSGAMAVLHKNEKILNAEETVKFDELYNHVKIADSTIMQLSNMIKSPNNYNMPSVVQGFDASKFIGNVVNNKNDNSSRDIHIENTYQVDATSDFKVKTFGNNLDKQFKDTLRRFGKI